MVKKIIAVVAGVFAWGMLWVGGNAALSGAFPDQYNAEGAPTSAALLAGVIAFSAVLSVLAGFLCAKIASGKPGRVVLTLALVQLGIGVLVQVGAWDLFPVWYHAAFLVLVVPMHLLGGRVGSK